VAMGFSKVQPLEEQGQNFSAIGDSVR